jgi:hypothetical protein
MDQGYKRDPRPQSPLFEKNVNKNAIKNKIAIICPKIMDPLVFGGN